MKNIKEVKKHQEVKKIKKVLKDDLSKIFTYHIDRWYDNEGNKEVLYF